MGTQSQNLILSGLSQSDQDRPCNLKTLLAVTEHLLMNGAETEQKPVTYHFIMQILDLTCFGDCRCCNLLQILLLPFNQLTAVTSLLQSSPSRSCPKVRVSVKISGW